MGVRGPLQKSAVQKKLAGTEQPCRPRAEESEAELVKFVPDPPKWIEYDTTACDVWRRLAPLLVTDGLAVKDLDTMANLCLTQSRIIRNVADPTVSAVGAMATYCRLGAALGLAPAWRARVATSGSKETKNPFDAFKGRSN